MELARTHQDLHARVQRLELELQQMQDDLQEADSAAQAARQATVTADARTQLERTAATCAVDNSARLQQLAADARRCAARPGPFPRAPVSVQVQASAVVDAAATAIERTMSAAHAMAVDTGAPPASALKTAASDAATRCLEDHTVECDGQVAFVPEALRVTSPAEVVHATVSLMEAGTRDLERETASLDLPRDAERLQCVLCAVLCRSVLRSQLRLGGVVMCC